MTTDVATRPHADGVKAALSTLRIGDGKAPADKTLPYGVFWDFAGGEFDGPVSDPEADVVWPFTVICNGSTPEQARWLHDKVRTLLASVTVAGRVVTRLESLGLPQMKRDDSLQPPIFYVTPQWKLHTTPA